MFRITSECKNNVEKLNRWLRCIPRQGLEVTECTVICIKHFSPHFIMREDSVKRPDGSILTVQRSRPKLTPDAYPSLFENCPDLTTGLTQATTVQAFMLCSLLSSNTDMAALVPVKNINGKFLKDLTVDVMRMVENAGFKVVCLISDNNRINGNTFAALAGDKLVSHIDHPLDSNRKLFFLFDSVHLMKCV